MTLNERTKHRLVGFSVLFSVVLIFAPAMMKKANQDFKRFHTSTAYIPRPPAPPQVAMPSQKMMFQKIKVAKVHIPKVTQHVEAKAMSNVLPIQSQKAVPVLPSQVIAIQDTHHIQIARKTSPQVPSKIVRAMQGMYAVQVASFSDRQNATRLIQRLQSAGYQVQIHPMRTAQGQVYKVLVGSAPTKEHAQNIKEVLAKRMEIRGFVVPTQLG